MRGEFAEGDKQGRFDGIGDRGIDEQRDDFIERIGALRREREERERDFGATGGGRFGGVKIGEEAAHGLIHGGGERAGFVGLGG